MVTPDHAVVGNEGRSLLGGSTTPPQGSLEAVNEPHSSSPTTGVQWGKSLAGEVGVCGGGPSLKRGGSAWVVPVCVKQTHPRAGSIGSPPPGGAPLKACCGAHLLAREEPLAAPLATCPWGLDVIRVCSMSRATGVARSADIGCHRLPLDPQFPHKNTHWASLSAGSKRFPKPCVAGSNPAGATLPNPRPRTNSCRWRRKKALLVTPPAGIGG